MAVRCCASRPATLAGKAQRFLAGTDQRSGIVAGLPMRYPRVRAAGPALHGPILGPQVEDALGLALEAGHGAGIPDLDLGRDPDRACDVPGRLPARRQRSVYNC